MLTQWLTYILAQVGIGVYVWGAQGQTVADVGGVGKVRDWICRRYASQSGDAGANDANAAKAWGYFQDLSARIGVDRVRFYDCSGLGMYFFQRQGLSGDLSAAGMYRRCAPTGRAQLKPGDWCFKTSGGRISHIGYVAADGQVIEARQSGMGVVKRAASAGGWTLYGRPSWLAEEIEQGASATPTLKRGSAGPAVARAQARLLAHGCSLPLYGADGDFGAETEVAVRAFQAMKRLETDGVIGPATWAALLALPAAAPRYSYTLQSADRPLLESLVRQHGGAIAEVI